MTNTDQRADAYADRIRSACAAVVEHDLDRALAHFDDNCVFVDGTTGRETGKDGLLAFLDEMWSMFPDFAPRVVAAHVAENTIGVLFESTGTLVGTGDASTPGKQVRWIATGFSTFDPDSLKILRDVYFVDTAALEQKVGEAQAG
ncbi:nuclear transport factor 2 family protein [Rhodococcus pseudokoreensis]|uniref:Nuclear transport factor 2 family protein n=1 Tax=Rhodococcus pseudokoreensis TaxID=2811421 RepID=A0A974W5A0_9NOCA|nr:nuclear transport factor 2 family protein [Rhodococcus pseudokoreensis]QSE91529.1 nuclear transport factor 2 family protein [Rhodococcus pseudokoreensis]